MARVVTICGGTRREWPSRKKAMDFFWEGVCCCDGSERERYLTIYEQLKDGSKEASDEDYL